MTRAINVNELHAALLELGSIKAVAERLGVSDRTITRRRQSDPAVEAVVSAGLAKRRELTYPHGSDSGYGQGCRCDACRSAHAAATRLRRAEKATRLDEAPHGTANTYTNWGCRCAPCTAAHSAALKRRRSTLEESR